LAVAGRGRGTFDAVLELHLADRRHGDAPLGGAQPRPGDLPAVPEEGDEDVRVEQVERGHSAVRSSAAPWSRSSRKSGSARSPWSNHSSQPEPTGSMMRARPTTRTSTSRTSSGRATAFGSRTAWVRLLRKTVVRTMTSCISQKYIQVGSELLVDRRVLVVGPAVGPSERSDGLDVGVGELQVDRGEVLPLPLGRRRLGQRQDTEPSVP